MSLVLNRPTGPAPVPVPHLKAVKDLFEGLTGRDVEIASGADPVAVGGASGSLVGLYVDASMETRALVMFDVALAAYSGAALGLLPPGAAQDAVDAGALTETLVENCSEVLNVFASLFNVPNAPHLKLYSVIGPDDELRADVRELAVRAAPRDDIALEIARYGRGRLSVVVR
ncbi:hypothetical protein [Aquipuribacter nitratireducens]|uniref:Chemotaxis phosphatase CheX-like domain-containing protein n=1 Tax=Aquipuribacter nitratireducens TaxID=650104 RepID=A0ABW0GMC4_9MICO